jgi:hypothetical protein
MGIEIREAVEEEGGPHSPRNDRRHADAGRPPLDMEGMAQAQESPLAGVICTGVRPGPLRGGRSDVDDLAAALPPHLRKRQPGEQERPAQVHVQNAVPVRDADLLDGQRQVDARIVDQDVETTVAFHDGAERLFD